MFTKEEQALTKPCYEAIKKISKGRWKWEPKVGEYFMHFTSVSHSKFYLITEVDKTFVWFAMTVGGYGTAKHTDLHNWIPLLHWERIERVLEEMGYYLKIWDTENTKIGSGYYVVIGEKKSPITEDLGKTRQEAVMKAVIELEKEE